MPMDNPTLTRMIQPALPGAVAASSEALDGMANNSYRVVLDGRDSPVVVRVYTRAPESAAKEWEIMTHVSRRLPVPSILWHGQIPELCDKPYAVLRWVDGVPLDTIIRKGGADAHQAAYAAGEVLGRIGSFTLPKPGFIGPGLTICEPMDSFAQAVRQCAEECAFKGLAAERMERDLAARMWAFAMQNAARLNRIRDGKCLIHADFHGRHLIMRRARGVWTVAGVLDWEFAFSGPQLFDMGQMIRYKGLPAEYHDDFARGFADHGGELPDDWRTLGRVCDLVNLLQFLSREDLTPEMLKHWVNALRYSLDEEGA
jgi:aminoglycoside phosphotransferase (APT) family kinase protein